MAGLTVAATPAASLVSCILEVGGLAGIPSELKLAGAQHGTAVSTVDGAATACSRPSA